MTTVETPAVMRLYHASNVRIPEPDIHHGRRNADLGQGFYLTPDLSFAQRWVKGGKDTETFINYYELSTESLKILYLDRDETWYEYIFGNRHLRPDPYPDADVIIGPVANDILYDVMGIITSGFLSKEEALTLLQLGPVYTQAVIKTEKAAAQLCFLKAETINAEELAAYGKAVREEERRYQEQVADALSAMNEDEA